ncbi:MAG: glycoside hydrolase family 3 C-terminal domain-containing protein [Candidatus Lokiarchaeota archaeon]|nr:glycoside hydrolase family 3 C-terminal domain-containing protein [Candidatus Harpocratesius repetitus]
MKDDHNNFEYNPPLDEQVEILLSKLTLNEKIQLLRGKDFWTTNSIDRIGLPSFGMTDGPLGVAYHSSKKGIRTRFPATIGLAATWNRDLAFQMGKAMSEEVKLSGRHQLLAPGINLIRSPLCGRNFEYLSEDPFLSSEFGADLVKGIQSEGIAACVKHFVANNSETKRMKISVEIDERTLFEIYIRNFRRVIEKSDPWGIMASYNKINGVYAAENQFLLQTVLREQLGFTGHVVSDWGAANWTKGVASCIKAGLNLEMPSWSKTLTPKKILKALKENEISQSDIDFALRPMLRTFFRVGLLNDKNFLMNRIPKVIDDPSHQNVAQRIAEESMVLLKNENNFLPFSLSDMKKIAIIGPNANKKFGKPFQGGSSAAVPPFFITPKEGIIKYINNYNKKAKKSEEIKIIDKFDKIDEADAVLLVLGLDHGGNMFRNIIFGVDGDTEGSDRKNFALSEKQENLIHDTVAKNPNTVVVLIAGSPVDIFRWYDDVPAILNAWYPGMMGGKALARIIFGELSPSGKLPVTYPKYLKDHPAHQSQNTFPGDLKAKKIYYNEGIYIGYRYFDKYSIDPLFPFGYGLSYTTFSIRDISCNNEICTKEKPVVIKGTIENTGKYLGAEVIQVYVKAIHSNVERAPKELQGFTKIWLNPGEQKEFRIEVEFDSFKYYSEEKHSFIEEPGEYTLWIGTSSRNLPFSIPIRYINA